MNKQSETGVLQPPSQNGMFIPRQSIVPLRMGIRYEPPTLALIYKRHETDVKERIYWILLNGLVEWRDARQIARRLLDEHTLMINESIIDIDQVEKLVAKIKKQHKEKTNQSQNQLHPDGDISTSHIGLTNSFISPIHTYNSTSKNNAYNISEGELFLENSPNPLQNGSSGYLEQKHSYNHPIIPMIVEEGDIPEDIQTMPDSATNLQGNKFNNNQYNIQHDGQYLHTMSQDDNSERFNSPYIPSLSSATTNTNIKPRYEQQSPQSPPINTNQLKSNSSNNNDNALGEDSPSVQHSSQQRAKTKNERNKHHLNHNDDVHTASFKNINNNDVINNNNSDDYEFAENTKSFGITENVSAEAQYLTSQYNYGKRRQQQQQGQDDSNQYKNSSNNPNAAIGGIGAFNAYENTNDYYDGSKQSELNIDHYENNEFVDHDAYSNDQIYNSQNQHTLNHDYHDLIADSQINNTNPSDHLFQTPNNNNNIGNKNNNNNNNNNSSSSASVNLSSNQHPLRNVFGNYNMNNNNISSYSNNAQHIQIPSSLSVSNQSENFQFSSTPIKGYIDTQIEFNNNNASKINSNNQFIDSYDHNEFIAAITSQNQFGGNTFQKHANIAQQQQQQQYQQQEQYDLVNQGNSTSNMNKSNNAPFFQKRISVSLDQQLQQQMMFNRNNNQQQQQQEQSIEQQQQQQQQQDSKKRKGRFGQLKDLATMHRDNEDQRDELEVI